MSMKVDGARIRALRLEQSWSQELLAEQAGVSLRTIQRMETDDAASLQSRRAVAESLGVPVSEITPAAATASPVTDNFSSAETPAPPPPKPARIRLSRRETLATVGVGALVIFGLLLRPWLFPTWQEIRSRSGLPEQSPSRIVTVDYADIEDVVIATGVIEPTEVIPFQARISGVLLEVLAAVGDEVSEGQVLARMNSETQELRVHSARLSLEQLINRIPQHELNLQHAEAEFMQIDLRYTNGIDVELDLDRARRALLDARTKLADLQIDIQRSQTELQREEVLLSHTEIRAPVTGTVIGIDARERAVLRIDETAPVVLRMADLTQMSIKATISERDIARLSTGTETWFTTYGNSERRPASVRQFDPMPTADRSVVQFIAQLNVENPDRSLYAGMTVNLQFVTSRAENVPAVPVSSLLVGRDPDGNEVVRIRVALPDGGSKLREITIGARDRNNAEVTSGLVQGDRVLAK